MQRGSLRKKSGSWHVRYRVTEIGPDGQPQRRMVSKRLAPVNAEYRSASDVWPLADAEVLRETGGGAAEGSLLVADFVRRFFLPFVTAKRKASTLRFYRDTIQRNVTPVIGQLRLRDVQTVHIQNYSGTELMVRRSVWRTFTGHTKMPESKAVVPVISPLKKMLDAHHQRNGDSTWIFAGGKKGFALNLDNLARRSIIPKVGERWHGWRRGLASILFDLSVDPEISSKILRHADSAVAKRHYIMLESRKQGRKAMRKLESLVAKKVKTTKTKKKSST